MIDPVSCAAIPFPAFTDAVNKYEDDSATDDEGDMTHSLLGQLGGRSGIV